nr:hypothetical protein DMOBY_13640 [Dehalococcoides mccartyi]
MDVHYFQRYHQKENVSTGNVILLLSRLYHYSPQKFHSLLDDIFEDKFSMLDTGVKFSSQIKRGDSVPDGIISQKSFNIIIETKLNNSFDTEQLKSHLNNFEHENYQILLTLDPNELTEQIKTKIYKEIEVYNNIEGQKIYHSHLTFEGLIKKVREQININQDWELTDIINDFEEYCNHDKLLSNTKYVIRAVPVGATYDENIKYKIYHAPTNFGFVNQTYLALYKNKSIKAVGKIIKAVEADVLNGTVESKNGEVLDPSQKQIIKIVSELGMTHGWEINKEHTFYFVDNFYETEYIKKSKYPIQSSKRLDARVITGNANINSAEDIAKAINGKEW